MQRSKVVGAYLESCLAHLHGVITSEERGVLVQNVNSWVHDGAQGPNLLIDFAFPSYFQNFI